MLRSRLIFARSAITCGLSYRRFFGKFSQNCFS